MVNTVISTFAGGGGSSLGYQWAGFDELLAIDFEKNACDTLKANFPDLTVWQRDITTVQVNEILQQCKIKLGNLDILDGSPPCQGFSTAGKRNLNDSRNDLNIEPSFPEPLKTFITFKEITKDLQNNELPPLLSPCFRPYVSLMKQGQCISDVGGRGFQTARIYNDKVCPTITKIIGGIGFGTLIHPFEDRVLSIPELKRVCSFPDDYKLIGEYKIQKARLGNAVMPKMMYHIAKHIKESILINDK